MKKQLSLLLAAVLLLLMFPCPALAKETEDSGPQLRRIYVQQDELAPYTVISQEGDLLFSGEDLSDITGFTYAQDGSTAVFTRGAKKVQVDLGKSLVKPMTNLSLGITPIPMESAVTELEGRYYFSGASLLPWLNVTCFVEDGKLFIFRDAVSMWDTSSTNLRDSMFDFIEACEDMGLSKNAYAWLIGTSYIKNQGSKIVYYASPYGEYKDYYNVFDKMFQNKEGISNDYFAIAADQKRIKTVYSFLEKCKVDNELPEELQSIFKINKNEFEVVSKAVDYLIYYQSFQEDNTEKLAMMQAVKGGFGIYDQTARDAAKAIYREYTNFMEGITLRTLTDAVEKGVMKNLPGGGYAKVILGVLDIVSAYSETCEKDIDKIRVYDALSLCALERYNQLKNQGTHAALEEARLNAQLYYYANSQEWKIMAAYAKFKNPGKFEYPTLSGYDPEIAATIRHFTDMQEQCTQMQALYLTTASSSYNDAVDGYTCDPEQCKNYPNCHLKQEDTDFLLHSAFKDVRRHFVDDFADFDAIEYALILQSMENGYIKMNDPDYNYTDVNYQNQLPFWGFADADGDGKEELLAAVGAVLWMGAYTTLIFDTDAGIAAIRETIFETDANGNESVWIPAHMYATVNGQQVYVNAQTSFDVITDAEQNRYSFWNGTTWEDAALSPGTEYSLTEIPLPSQDYHHVHVSGNMEQLNLYLMNRYNLLGYAEGDVNQDGVVEQCYFYRDPAALWLADFRRSVGHFVDETLIAVVATPTGDGADVHIATVPLTDAAEEGIAGDEFLMETSQQRLFIGTQEYSYTDSGFRLPGTLASSLAELIGMPQGELRNLAPGLLFDGNFDNFFSETGLTCQDPIGLSDIDLYFDRNAHFGMNPDAQVECAITQVFTPEFIGVNIVGDMAAGMYLEQAKTLCGTTSTWTPVMSMWGTAPIVIFYCINSRDVVCKVTLTLGEQNDTYWIMSAQVERGTDIPEAIRYELGLH